jgi:Fic family protein
MYLSERTINNLKEKLKELNKFRPISPSILKKIIEQFEIEMTYNSNAIEGNSLTMKETFWVIQEGLTIKDKPLKDHLEARNHKEALDFLYELIDKDAQNTISEYLIRQLHQLVVQDSQKEIAGKYREGEVYISGAKHRPPAGIDVPHHMHNLIKWLHKNEKKLHPIELAAILHHKFVHIHPFWDGNGRVGRLLMNIVVLQATYPLAIILRNDRKRYYRVLALADEENYKPLCEMVAQAVLRSLSIYLKILRPQKERKSSEQYVSLKELSKKSTFSEAYLRKLANLGKLEAFKEGRNWLSSEKALWSYKDSINN